MNELAQSSVGARLPSAVETLSTAPAIRHIPSLDGLRALSFLFVFVAHAGVESVPGGFGVTVFFFLSGFLITTLLRSEFDRHGTLNMPHFWLRRVLRILPPCYLVLLIAVVRAVILGPPGIMTPAGIAAQVFQYTNYWVIGHGNDGLPPKAGTGVYWSLAVEEHFYLLFPWLYLAMRRACMSGRRQALLLWGLCGLVLVWRTLLVMKYHVPLDRTYMASDTRVDSILFGCALAVWYNPMLDRYSTPAGLWKYGITPLCAGLLGLTMLVRNPEFRETWRYSMQGLLLAPLFVAAIRFPQWGPFRVLNWGPVVFLGVLSYGLYLLHYGVIFAVQDYIAAPALVQGLLALGISILLAWMINVALERPCAALRRRLAD